MRKCYKAVSVDNATIKSIKAKLGNNYYHEVSTSHQIRDMCKVVSRFNAKNPFSLDSILKATPFVANVGFGV